MDAADIRKSMFYMSYIVSAVLVLLYFSGNQIGYDPITYYVRPSTVEIFAVLFVLAVWFVFVMLGKRGIGEEGKQQPGFVSTMVLLLFVYFSTFISLYYLENTVNKYYLVIFLFSLIPFYTVQDFKRRKKPRRRMARVRQKKSIPQDFVYFAALAFSGYLILTDSLTIVYLSAFVLILTLLSASGKNYEYSRNSYISARIVLPYAISYLIVEYYTLYDVIDRSGILLLAMVTLAVLVFTGLLIFFRRRKGVYTLSMLLLFLFGSLGILDITSFYNSNPMTLLVVITVVAWLLSLAGKATIEDNRNIGNSFKIFSGRSTLYIPVVLIALYGYFRFFQFPIITDPSPALNLNWLSTAFSSTMNYAITQTIGITAILLLSLAAVAVVVGSRKMNPVLFMLLLVLFGYGFYTIISYKVPGIWEISSLYTNLIVVIVTIAVFYEPSFRFMRSYSSKISRRFSISYQVGTARYLRGRFDVDTTVDKKKNKDYLGAGGFAYVFKGKDILNNQDVVVKVPRVFDEESKTDRERKQHLQESIRQLYAESKILSQIEYPGIVRLVDYFKEGDQHYLVEEFADGKNMSHILGDSVRNGTPLDEPTTIKVALSLLFSLNYLHLHEIYHRDLNPGNIVLSKLGPKIIDFGTSKNLSLRVSTAFFTHSQRIGVPCYHPPELDLEDKIMISPSYDTYSVGALICSMLTGKFLDNTEMKKNYGYEFITDEYLQREIRPRASDWFFRIISKTLTYKAEDRYQSAFEMIADIMGIGGNFIVTDTGQIYPLEREAHYDIAMNKDLGVPELGSNLIRSKRIDVFEDVKGNPITVAQISYDQNDNMFKLQSTGRRNFYMKALGAYPERRNEIFLVPRLIYSFRQDLRNGSFSFYSVR